MGLIRKVDKELQETWVVAEAKARLSEVLRLAREVGPQRVGAEQPCVVLSEGDYRALMRRNRSLGTWLVDDFAGVGETAVRTLARGIQLERPPRHQMGVRPSLRRFANGSSNVR